MKFSLHSPFILHIQFKNNCCRDFGDFNLTGFRGDPNEIPMNIFYSFLKIEEKLLDGLEIQISRVVASLVLSFYLCPLLLLLLFDAWTMKDTCTKSY
jgi:hypothetical protein